MTLPEPPELGTIGRPPRRRRRLTLDRVVGVLLVGIGAWLVAPVLLNPPAPAPSVPAAAAIAVASPTAIPFPTLTPLPAGVHPSPRPTDSAGDTVPATPAPTEPPPTSAPPEELQG